MSSTYTKTKLMHKSSAKAITIKLNLLHFWALEMINIKLCALPMKISWKFKSALISINRDLNSQIARKPLEDIATTTTSFWVTFKTGVKIE
jgi:hypothetical protein